MSDSLRPHGLYPTRLLCPWDFPYNSTGVDCHFLLQGTFPTQGSNPGLPHCRQTLNHLSHQGSPYTYRYIQYLYTHQLYVNQKLPDVQAGFRKGRGTRDQIVNICWIIEKAREFQKNIYFCFIDYTRAFE